jgi:DNA-binding protein H-NS
MDMLFARRVCLAAVEQPPPTPSCWLQSFVKPIMGYSAGLTNLSGSRAVARISDLEKLSVADLNKMEAQIARLKTEKQNAERAEVRQKAIDMAEAAGFDIQELFGKGSGRARGKVAVKYRDPKNPENTWTGRGRMPRWMAAATKGGKAKREDFLI